MVMIEQARRHLEQLDLAAKQQVPNADFLADLLRFEVAARRERYLRTRMRLAHLPFQRTLEQFDFRFQPSIDERQIRELSTLACVSEAADVVFLGPLRSTPGMACISCARTSC